ncbi:formate dehydrogenase protein [Renibacterium salmoninarum ATCC 33209]|uniref:Formate dehydrogenase protein n=1 Tax=Renibacterium salmoninarum (strain ATCC 33209 / DSM 20767 / JCM 11484 / NBRC 15589 / NCIMB 2235) TaxID=288705 RepID=A9WKZ2_RENSM|nr:formate dehydrogenase protein [Renibacterium salmoninarum ATCC 33209]
MAVELAEESGIALIGLSRGKSLNVYSGLEKIALERN